MIDAIQQHIETSEELLSSHVHADDTAIRTHEHAEGNSRELERHHGRTGPAPAVEDLWPVELLTPQPPDERRAVLNVDAHADDGDSIAKATLHFAQRRNLGEAWCAPGRPEIE